MTWFLIFAGLSQLREADLKQMKWEMSDKFRHLSEVLVRELQERDQLIHSLNVKNTFISALLKVQALRYHPSEEKLPKLSKVTQHLNIMLSSIITCILHCSTYIQ